MSNPSKNYQILAPAGSVEQLQAAVNNGCDAVYLGLENFNARMKAANFTAENIAECVNYCHFFGVKVYVAVNTSVKNEEFSRARDTILTAYRSNADGVIVTDLALLSFAARLPKPFEIVASTQLNIHDGYGARLVKNLGATTVVCARECSFEQIAEVAATGIQVECFLHGALCVCQSGQCLFSSMVGGNSGNRGLCAQPCRKLYYASEGQFESGGYLLSAADVSSLHTASKLLDSGVTTFKIEGRNRRAEYAGATAKVYSEFFENGCEVLDEYSTTLAEMYNRGNLPKNNYLFGNNSDIIYPFAPNHIGVPVGKVKNGAVWANVPLQKGDGLKVFNGKKEMCGAMVLENGVGMVSCEFSAKVSDGWLVHRTSSIALSSAILHARRKLPVSIHLTALAERCATLTLTSGEVCVSVDSPEPIQRALNAPTTDAELRQQLCKIGDLPYTITDIVCEIDEIFLPKSQINGMRRQAFQLLTEEILSEYNRQFASRNIDSLPFIGRKKAYSTEDSTPCLAVICKTTDEVQIISGRVKYVIYKPEILNAETLNCASFVYLDLPSFADINYLTTLIEPNKMGVVCHNIGHVQFARERGLRYIAGSGLNIFNDNMAEIFCDADTFIYSQELTLREISKFENKHGIIFVDGNLTLMKLTHCPYKLCFNKGCENCQAHRTLTYTDELGNCFSISRRRDSKCTFELINGKKLSVVSKLRTSGRYCVDFHTEVITHYENLNNDICDGFVERRPYTKGRLFNKIN